MPDYKIGSPVLIKNTPGVIKFIGPTEFAPGTWYGIELSQPNGKNNGTIDNVSYFQCKPNHGIFIRENMLRPSESTMTRIIDKLQIKLKAITIECQQYKQTIQTSLDKIESLESQLLMKTTENDYLSTINQKLTQDLTNLQEKYQQLEHEFKLVQEELELEHEISFTEDDPADRVKQLELALINLKQNSQEIETKLQTEINQLKGIVDISQFEELQAIIEHLTQENHEFSSKITSLNNNIEQLNEIHELDKQLEETQRQNELELKHQVDKLTKEIETNTAKIEQLEKRNLALSKPSNGSNTVEVTEYELQLQSTQQTIRDLKLKSKSDSRKLELLQQRYNILHQQTTSSQLTLQLNISDLTILLTKLPLNSPKQMFEYFILSELKEFYMFIQEYISLYPIELDLSNLNSVLHTITTQFIQDDDLNQELIRVIPLIHTMLPQDTFPLLNNLYAEFIISLQQLQYQFSMGVLSVELQKQLNIVKPDIHIVDMDKQVVLESPEKLVEQINQFVSELYSWRNVDDPDLKINPPPQIEISYIELPPTPEEPAVVEKVIEPTKEVQSTLLSELNSKIFQKDQQVSDLKLNIEMLEQNMKSLTIQNSQNLNNLKQEISQQNQQIENYIECIKSLEFEKSQLMNVEPVQEPIKQFSDLKSQLEYNENLRLAEQISHLKQLTKLKLATSSQDYTWLKQQEQPEKWKKSTPFIDLSRDLRSIALDVKGIRLDSNIQNSTKNLPRYVTLKSQEQFIRYQTQRNNLFT
ncbi:hypothetical protein JA1_001065 [Spathaspora sp. JA1]|nr:hypothetical protein JA1_001065 [Spathaspora sp. JA1]